MTRSEATAAGWFGNETATYFVTESGNLYLVQSDDTIAALDDGPMSVASLPDDAEPCEEGTVSMDLWDAVEELV